MLFQLPRDCRVYTKMSPSNQWNWAEIFSNKTNYLLEVLIWQNSYNPKNKSKHRAMKPKPFVPDFMKKPPDPNGIDKGKETRSTEEIRNILDLPRG